MNPGQNTWHEDPADQISNHLPDPEGRKEGATMKSDTASNLDPRDTSVQGGRMRQREGKGREGVALIPRERKIGLKNRTQPDLLHSSETERCMKNEPIFFDCKKVICEEG